MTKDEKVLEALRLASTASTRPDGWTTSEEVDKYGSEVGLKTDISGRTIHIYDLEYLHRQGYAKKRFVAGGLLPHRVHETLWQFKPVR